MGDLGYTPTLVIACDSWEKDLVWVEWGKFLVQESSAGHTSTLFRWDEESAVEGHWATSRAYKAAFHPTSKGGPGTFVEKAKGHAAVMERRMKRAVSDYITHHRNDAIKELQFYRDRPTLGQVITRAAHACTAGGVKHPHQRRIPRDALRKFGTRLSGSKRAMQKATSFDELHKIVREVGEPIYMIGELTIYDTAHRIGYKLSLLPTKVYLHSGTQIGAGIIGIKRSRSTVSVSELPEPFAALKPYEIEDCLCIFKELLSSGRSLCATGCMCNGLGCVR